MTNQKQSKRRPRTTLPLQIRIDFERSEQFAVSLLLTLARNMNAQKKDLWREYGFDVTQAMALLPAFSPKEAAQEIVGKVNAFSEAQMRATFKEHFGINIAPQFESNLQMRLLQQDLASRLEGRIGQLYGWQREDFIKTIQSAQIQGLRHEVVGKRLQERYGVTETYAKFLARDANSKVNSELNTQRLLGAGFEEFRWQTSGDNRVRPTHRANNGKIFRIDTPPPETGLPGHDYQCRCTMIPVLGRKSA